MPAEPTMPSRANVPPGDAYSLQTTASTASDETKQDSAYAEVPHLGAHHQSTYERHEIVQEKVNRRMLLLLGGNSPGGVFPPSQLLIIMFCEATLVFPTNIRQRTPRLKNGMLTLLYFMSLNQQWKVRFAMFFYMLSVMVLTTTKTQIARQIGHMTRSEASEFLG